MPLSKVAVVMSSIIGMSNTAALVHVAAKQLPLLLNFRLLPAEATACPQWLTMAGRTHEIS